jgi:Phosphodiester glycosidase
MFPEERVPIRRQFISVPTLFEEDPPVSPFEFPINASDDLTRSSTASFPTVSAVQQPSWMTPPAMPLTTGQKRRRRLASRRIRKKRLPLWFAVCSVITVLIVVLVTQGNGSAGAWMADTLRSVVGPTATAQIESWYLTLSNTSTQVQYKLGNKKVTAPWNVSNVTPSPVATSQTHVQLPPMTLTAMRPLIMPALPGEGAWTILRNAPASYSYLPQTARAYIRPDPANPYAIVTMLQFDTRFARLHIAGGTVEPGGPRRVYGPGVIPATDVKGNALLAAFNGGFKYADGQYGLMTNGVVYVPPQPGAATIAITRQGKLILGAWGEDALLNSGNRDIVAWRQNGALLIDKGVINPLTHDGAAWGGTVLNSAYTWRSAIGITAEGTLIYAAGNSLTAETLGQALKSAGAMMAMQTDINPFWVRAFLYNRDRNGRINVAKLNPQMQGSGYEYLYGTQRDFFYLTNYAPPATKNAKPLANR